MGALTMYVSLAIILLSVPHSLGLEHCKGLKKGWIKFDNNCYLFQYSYENRVSYYDAEDFCRSKGAYLVSIHSEAENDFILQTIEKQRLSQRHWIGLNVLSGKESPQWSDGSSVDYQKRVEKEFYVNEKCFIMFQSKKGWRPEHCALHYAPICKSAEDAPVVTLPPPTTPPPPEGHCPKGWIQREEKCYKYFGQSAEDRLDHKGARDACWALGERSDLVSIHSSGEQALLTQHLYELGTSAWIGMRQVSSDEVGHDLVFGWIDNSRTDFTRWAKGHPPPGTWKYCASLNYEGVGKGEWIADYCEVEKRGYICQMPSDPSLPSPEPVPDKCGEGSKSYRDSCYRFMTDRKTQTEAEETCKDLGGHLVSITDGFEEAFLHSFHFSGRAVWTGLRTLKGTPYLKWTDGSALYYMNFADGQPQLGITESECVALVGFADLQWNVTHCGEKLNFICKTSKQPPAPYPETIGQCPDRGSPWIDIADRNCYQLAQSPDRVLSWDNALRYCLAKGMKMVQTYSDHQVKSLIAYLWKESYAPHLGLFRSSDSTPFVWTDNTQVKFTNWDAREPSSYPGRKHCVAFSQSTGKWKTVECSTLGLVICQYSKIEGYTL